MVMYTSTSICLMIVATLSMLFSTTESAYICNAGSTLASSSSFVLALSCLNLFSTTAAQPSTTTDDAKTWATGLSNKFIDLMDNKMRVPDLQDLYDKTPVTRIQVDGKVEAAAASAELQSILDNKDNELRTLSDAALTDSASALMVKLKAFVASDPAILRAYFTPHDEAAASQVLASKDPDEIVPDSSTIAQTTPDLVTGKPPTHYNSRTTPWYSNTVVGPKDIYVVVDASGMSDQDLPLLTQTLLSLITSVSPNDRLWMHYSAAGNGALVPLDTDCTSGGMLRGTIKSIDRLRSVITETSKLFALRKKIPSTSNDWKSMLGVAYDAIDAARITTLNQERAGILVLVTGNQNTLSAAKDLEPFMLERNDPHTKGIPTDVYEIDSSQDEGKNDLQYLCTNMGTSSKITSDVQAIGVGMYYEHIVEPPAKAETARDQHGSVTFWGGLFAPFPRLLDFGGKSSIDAGANTHNVMTVSRAVYVNKNDDDMQTSDTRTTKLAGVIAVDMSLSSIKKTLDTVSANMGRTSFPILVTPHGDAVYHELMTRYKSTHIFDLNNDISFYEYFQDTKDITKSFAKDVRPFFLDGKILVKKLRVYRALPAGDAATEGFDGKEIETHYYMTPVHGWDLRLALVYDQFDLTTISMHPKPGPKFITSALHHYDQLDEKNSALVSLTTRIPGFKMINQENCKDLDGNNFGNCKPDVYCARVLDAAAKNQEVIHPVGVQYGAPACVEISTCVCERHRWPVGLTALGAAVVHVAPKSLTDPQLAYDRNTNTKGAGSPSDTKLLAEFLNMDDFSVNPEKFTLRADSMEHITTAAPLITKWTEDLNAGLHEATVWLYYGAATGMTLIYPPAYFGLLWDPTRRPWYSRCIASPKSRAVISTPYKDSLGAGLICTLTEAVWGQTVGGEKKVNGVMGFDFLYSTMNGVLPSLTKCSSEKVREIGQKLPREISCYLIEKSGLFLTHSDFLLSDEEKKEMQGVDSGDGSAAAGSWPIANVFIGVKEPDLADALIANNILVENTDRSPDSTANIIYYKINDSVFSGTSSKDGVISGTLDLAQTKCLEVPADGGAVSWFITPIAETNAYILIVDGYRRKSSECQQQTKAKPPQPLKGGNGVIGKCFKQNLFTSSARSSNKKMFQCPVCRPGHYSAVRFDICKPCPKGTFSKFSNAATCDKCIRGQYSEVEGQAACQRCDVGSYSLQVGASKNPCKKCPSGASCSGKNANVEGLVVISNQGEGEETVLSHTSYWREATTNISGKNASSFATCFYKCAEPTACLGTIICRDSSDGTGDFCTDSRAIMLRKIPTDESGSSNTSSSSSSSSSSLVTNTSIQWFDPVTRKCLSPYGIDSRFCTVMKVKETCANGYRGKACAGCLDSYSRAGTQCAKCPDESTALALVAVGAIFGLALYAYLIISTLKDFGALNRAGIIARVISSNILLVSLFKDLDIKWPGAVKSIMGAGAVAGDPVSLLNLECAWQKGGDIPFVIMKVLITNIMPIVFAILLGIIFLIRHLIHKSSLKKKNVDHKTFKGDVFSASLSVAMSNRFKNHKGHLSGGSDSKADGGGLMTMKSMMTAMVAFKGSLVVMIYMLYPSVIKNTFGLLECTSLAAMGKEEGGSCPAELRDDNLYFFKDQSVRCFDDQHNFWLVVLFLPSLLFYVFVVPIIFFLNLKKYANYIFAGPTLHRVIWGFLTSGFERDYYFWELIIQARKIVLIFIVVFMRPIGWQISAISCMMALLLFLAVHSHNMPFEDYHLDLLEKLSLLTNIIFLALGMLYNYVDENQAIYVTVMLAVVNLLFFGCAIRMYIEPMLAKARAKLHKKKEKDTKVVPSPASKTNTPKQLLILPTLNTKLPEVEEPVDEVPISLALVKEWKIAEEPSEPSPTSN